MIQEKQYYAHNSGPKFLALQKYGMALYSEGWNDSTIQNVTVDNTPNYCIIYCFPLQCSYYDLFGNHILYAYT